VTTTKVQWGVESLAMDGWHLWTGWQPSREAAVAVAMHFGGQFNPRNLRLVRAKITTTYEYEPFTHHTN